MPYVDSNEVVNDLSDSLPSSYQAALETSMRGSDFIFDSISLLYSECYKINSKLGGSYIDSPDWMKKKKNNKFEENR